MARTRQVDPIYPFENEIRALSIPARYFYLLSWCHMSDPNKEEKIVGGVLPHDLFLLKNNIFPEDDIDIIPIIEEIIALHRYFPFETEGKKWLWCPTMPKHQKVQHPSKRKYPDPPAELQEHYRRTPIALILSRVELSRVEIKDQPSEKLKATLDQILKDGFNIYKLLERLKKELKWEKGRLFPEEVLLKVCDSYAKNKATVKDQWAWFKVAIQKASEEYFAAKNIEEHRKMKEAGPVSLGELLRRMRENC